MEKHTHNEMLLGSNALFVVLAPLGGSMPNRLQWLRDRLTHDHVLIGAFILAFLIAALIWFLWFTPNLAMHFATGVIRLPPVF